MNTNLKQSDSVEVLSSTLSKPTSTILQLSHPTNVTRTINNTNSNNNNNNQTTTKSVRRFSCAVCNIDLSNQKHFNSHLNSRQHQQ
ncbi:unnamed protein product, partial [Rotaria socialis]